MDTNACPIGIITIERFDKGMDEVKRMYALLMEERDALLADNQLLRKTLYEVAHGKHSGRGYVNRILSESALPEHLKGGKI